MRARSRFIVLTYVAFVLNTVGCADTPSRPAYSPQIGWTKQQVLEDSIYRNTELNVMRTSTSQGTVETLVFGRPPYVFIYLDKRGMVTEINCIRDCR